MPERALVRLLLFAAFAGVGVFPWLATLSPTLGWSASLSGYVLATALTHPLVSAPSAASRRQSGVLSLALHAPVAAYVALVGCDPLPVAAVAAASLAVVRSAALMPGDLDRALRRELPLWVLSCVPAALMYDGTSVTAALSLWWFWLVQSGATQFADADECAEPRELDPPGRSVDADGAAADAGDDDAQRDAREFEVAYRGALEAMAELAPGAEPRPRENRSG